MLGNPIELFKENADIESNHEQPALKCPDFVDNNSFPMILEENRIHVDHQNTSVAKTKDFLTTFALLLCSHYVFILSYSRNLVSSRNIVLDDTAIPAKTLCFISKIRKTGLLSF